MLLDYTDNKNISISNGWEKFEEEHMMNDISTVLVLLSLHFLSFSKLRQIETTIQNHNELGTHLPPINIYLIERTSPNATIAMSRCVQCPDLLIKRKTHDVPQKTPQHQQSSSGKYPELRLGY